MLICRGKAQIGSPSLGKVTIFRVERSPDIRSPGHWFYAGHHLYAREPRNLSCTTNQILTVDGHGPKVTAYRIVRAPGNSGPVGKRQRSPVLRRGQTDQPSGRWYTAQRSPLLRKGLKGADQRRRNPNTKVTGFTQRAPRPAQALGARGKRSPVLRRGFEDPSRLQGGTGPKGHRFYARSPLRKTGPRGRSR